MAEGEDPLQTLRPEVQRLLGQCLLRLQRYELLMKAILANCDVSVPAASSDMVQVARGIETERKTLGLLVKDLLESYLVTEERRAVAEAAAEQRDDPALFSFRMQLGVPQEELDQIEDGLKELVELRNNLVHHFLSQHNFRTPEGLRGARDALLLALGQIGQRLEELEEWAGAMEKTRQQMLAGILSDEFDTVLAKGMTPDGKVYWPLTGVVSALRAAAAELAVDGWTPIKEAVRWISDRCPDEQPSDYGCASWMHVLQESRLFEIRCFQREGMRTGFYREKAHAVRPA